MAGREFNEDEFPLAELIDALAQQLGKARERANEIAARGGLPFIAWTAAQIEVGVTWTRTAEGGIDVKVLHLGGERTKENTTTMTVTLEPAEGKPIRMP
jgi:hypothetical protein